VASAEQSTKDTKQFWIGFLQAIGTRAGEPVESIPGASGLHHPVTAYGIDEDRRRLVIVSGDWDPRSAALAQADLQNKYSDLRVIFARPSVLSIGKMAEFVATHTGQLIIGKTQLEAIKGLNESEEFKAKAKEVLERVPELFRGFTHAPFDWVSATQDIVKQISRVKIDNAEQFKQAITSGDKSASLMPTLLLAPLIGFDPTEADRSNGICAVPLYDFTGEQAEIFQKGADVEAAQEVLRQMQIFQYFFPAPDHLALGLLERKPLNSQQTTQYIEQSTALGHPLGSQEILPGQHKIGELIDALKDRKLCAEGEFGFELTQDGKNQRAVVRFKPREGFLEQMSRVFKIHVDIKDIISLFKGPKA
jgi:hypothetical protein